MYGREVTMENASNKTREKNHIKLYFIISLRVKCEIDQKENEKSENGK